MTYQILTNGEWTNTYKGTEEEVKKEVEKRNKAEQTSGWNRKITYKATK